MLGEYLARIYEEVKARPLYIVAEEIGFDGKTADTRQIPQAQIPQAKAAGNAHPGPGA